MSGEGDMRHRILIIVGTVILLVFGYHYYVAQNAIKKANESISKKNDSNAEVELSVNPITNRVTVTLFPVTMENVKGNPLAVLAYGIGKAFGETLGKTIAPFAEYDLNRQAREHYDIYAIAIPYRLHFVVEEPDAKTLAKLHERLQVRQTMEEEARNNTAVYIKEELALDGIRITRGQLFGRPVTRALGTIVNRGQKTLREVRTRIYYLNRKGLRIGEKEYSPVLVGNDANKDNAPLRPGSRCDFSCSLDGSAPPGWAKKIEVEIVNIDFMEEKS
jgi:hypothetical protein